MNTHRKTLDWDSEALEEVYKRRARRLAERQTNVSEVATCGVLVFRVGEERYGIGLSQLTEVFPYRGCTAVPGTAAALLGVLNVRGEIRAITNGRRILGLPPGDEALTGYVVMVRQATGSIGITVDAVEGVREIAAAALSAGDDAAHSQLVKSLTADGVILIDAIAALSALELGTNK
jgi:purine-binding chemotaxis protein CheW